MRRRGSNPLRMLIAICGPLAIARLCYAEAAAVSRAPSTEPMALGDAGAEHSSSKPIAVSPIPPEALPPSQLTYMQYGIAFTVDGTASAGPICSGTAKASCIFGSGGGLAARLGQRWGDVWYVGGAYEMSKHDSGTLYRLGILQQLRAELRRYLPTEHDTQWFACGSLGAVAYGNEWDVADWGASASIGWGVESQIMNGPLVGVTLSYRPIFFGRFTDSSGLPHAPGFAHVIGIDLTLEGRERR